MIDKIAACYIVLNEEDYITYSLESIYDAVDHIYIVEGAVESIAEKESNNGLSLDNTTQLIQSFPDPQGKIQYIFGGVTKDKVGLRQKYLDRMGSDVDLILIVDGDELYTLQALDNIFKAFFDNPDMVWLGTDYYNFVGDFWHLLKKPQNMYPKPGFYFDRSGRSMVNGEYHERTFRYFPGVHYGDSHSTVQDSGRNFLYSGPKYRKNRMFIPYDCMEYAWIHYGYVRDLRRIEEKLGFHGRQYHGAVDDTSNRRFITDDFRFQLLLSGELGQDQRDVGMEWNHVPKFEHPEAMWKHPWYRMSREGLING